MQWEVTTPPVNTVLTFAQLAYHLRLDTDLAATSEEQCYITELLSDAVEYAEKAMQCSLITRTITATFWKGDELILPRGPVIAIASVSDTGGVITTSELIRRGNTDRLLAPNGWQAPLTVVYTAGFGANGTNVPPDIRGAIRAHVNTLYEYRLSVSDRNLVQVPDSLKAFYGLNCRQSIVS